MKYIFTSLLCFILAFRVLAQDSLLKLELKKSLYPIQVNESQWQGVGKDFLLQEANNSQFFLIGEDHGIAELPQFTTLLAKNLLQQTNAYQYFATETGPFTAAMLQEMASSKNPDKQFAEINQKYPWAIPFYFFKEECEILKAMMAHTANNQPRIWGLDQEFIGSPRILFQRLIKMAPTKEAKKLAQTHYQEAIAGFEETIRTQNPNSIFLYKNKPDVLQKLEQAFDGHTEALEIIHELKVSQDIYLKFYSKQGFASNVQRAELMKQHFHAYYKAAKAKTEKLPKVLFKFGANHMYRGANGLNAFDIGNFVSELSSIEQTQSFHLYVMGKKGTQNAYNPFGKEEDKQRKYDATSYLDHINVNPFLELTGEQDWVVFDLRPLRELLFYKKIKNLDQGLEKLIWSYDAVLVLPEVHASSLFE